MLCGDGKREREKAFPCYVYGKVFQNVWRDRSSWVSLDGTINFPVGAQIHYPAALMTHYYNHRVMSMAQYGFNCNTDSADYHREQI